MGDPADPGQRVRRRDRLRRVRRRADSSRRRTSGTPRPTHPPTSPTSSASTPPRARSGGRRRSSPGRSSRRWARSRASPSSAPTRASCWPSTPRPEQRCGRSDAPAKTACGPSIVDGTGPVGLRLHPLRWARSRRRPRPRGRTRDPRTWSRWSCRGRRARRAAARARRRTDDDASRSDRTTTTSPSARRRTEHASGPVERVLRRQRSATAGHDRRAAHLRWRRALLSTRAPEGYDGTTPYPIVFGLHALTVDYRIVPGDVGFRGREPRPRVHRRRRRRVC